MDIFKTSNIFIDDVELQVGDIILYKESGGILSKCVSFFTKSKYVHVSMMISDTLLIEANWYKKSNTISFKYDKTRMEIYRLKENLSNDQKLTLLQHCFEFMNKTYDYPQILGYIVRFFKKSQINLFNSKNKLICSELIDRAYLKIGVDLSSEHFIGDVTPKDIANSNQLYRVL